MDDHARVSNRHLWLHFTGGAPTDDRLVIERGEGCHVVDTHGRRYLDGLAGLYAVQVGHGREELAQAAYQQSRRLGYSPLWGYAHDKALELAARIVSYAPGDLDRVFLTTGGSDSVESAWKLAREHFRAVGQSSRTKVIARHLAYHGTSMGALSITGLPDLRGPFEPLVGGVVHVRNTNGLRDPPTRDPLALTQSCVDAVEQAIQMEGPETVAAIFVEPVQASGGSIPPPPEYFSRLRAVCDRYGLLLISDEVICAFGRIGHMFGCQRYGYTPDIAIVAKGLTSGYSPLGAVVVSGRVAATLETSEHMFHHGLTFGGHPVSCAVALANLDLFDREDICGGVQRREAGFRERLDTLRSIPLVGDVRGAGWFWTIELVRDQATLAPFPAGERNVLLKKLIGPRLLEEGLLCRVDDRVDALIQLAPPLVANDTVLDEMTGILTSVLRETLDVLTARGL